MLSAAEMRAQVVYGVEIWCKDWSRRGCKWGWILHKCWLALKNVDLEFCEDCMYGKQKRVRFARTTNEKKTQKLELVHSHVWSPTSTSSLGGASYYVTFIDDATKKT